MIGLFTASEFEALVNAADNVEAVFVDVLKSRMLLFRDADSAALVAGALRELRNALRPYRLAKPLPLDVARNHV